MQSVEVGDNVVYDEEVNSVEVDDFDDEGKKKPLYLCYLLLVSLFNFGIYLRADRGVEKNT